MSLIFKKAPRSLERGSKCRCIIAIENFQSPRWPPLDNCPYGTSIIPAESVRSPQTCCIRPFIIGLTSPESAGVQEKDHRRMARAMVVIKNSSSASGVGEKDVSSESRSP